MVEPNPGEERALIEALRRQLAELQAELRCKDASHRAAMAHLEQSEEKYRQLVENVSEVIYSTDEHGVLTYVSSAVKSLLEYEPPEVVGRQMLRFFHPDDRQRMVENLGRVLSGHTVSNEYRLLTRSGATRWVRTSSRPILDDGRMAGVFGVVSDVTEQKEAEENLRRSERRFRQLLDALQEGIWVIDQDARTTFVNPRMAEMLGYTVEEMLGRHLFDFMDEHGIAIAQRNLERRADGIREQHDFELLAKDGRHIYTLMETSPMTDEQGNYGGAVAGVLDITERRRAEEALQRSEALLQETQRIAHVGGWELHLATNQVVWTDEVARIHEVPPSFQPTLESALSFYHPEDRRLLEAAVKRASTGAEPWDLELRFRTASGRALWVRAIGRAEVSNGRVVRLAGTFQDITERKQIEQAALEASATAERNRLARDLHDSVTQSLFSASLVAEVLAQVWQKDPGEAIRSLEQLRRLTRGALAEMRAMLLELRPTALTESKLDDLLRQLAEALAGRAEVDVTLDVRPVPTLPPEVHVAFYRIAQEALQNVARHAEARHVAVRLEVSPALAPDETAGDWRGRVRLQVIDDGKGFHPASARADRLGLFIMRERAENIEAGLTVEACPGQGTQITLAWQTG